MTDHTAIDNALTAAGISMTAVFVPQSRGRYAIKARADNGKGEGKGGYCGKGEPCINWKCTVSMNGREAWTGDYSQGSGHLPEYIRHPGDRNSLMNYAAELGACESGKAVRFGDAIASKGEPLQPPDTRDVIYSLLMDSIADDMPFEDWCSEYGYDTDSRKAEATYHQCADTGRALRLALGTGMLDGLREVFQDY